MCGHDQYSHHGGYGRCYVVLVERESKFYEVSITPGIKAWTQDIEYGDECPCQVMMTWRYTPKHEHEPSPTGNLDDFF